MTLREALDLLELNERTLEQSMLETSLQNRLEHTDLRHVLRVFEAYRKVNAFLNPSFNTQGDARLTIVDESAPGMPAPELALAAPADGVARTAPARDTQSDTRWESGATPTDARDTFSENLVVTDAAQPVRNATVPKNAAPDQPKSAKGISALAFASLLGGAFAIGILGIGPLLGALTGRQPEVAVTSRPVEAVAPTVTPPAANPTPAPSSITPSIAPSAQPVAPSPQAAPASPVAASPAPTTPPAAARPNTPEPTAIKPAAPKPTATKPNAAPNATARSSRPTQGNAGASRPTVAPSQPRAGAVRPSTAVPRASSPVATAATPRRAPAQTNTRRATAPRATPARASSSRTTPARAAPRVTAPVAPTLTRRAANERQFTRWDRGGAVLRYRSWALVPDAVRRLSPAAFRSAVFVASSPATLPDIAR
jgi:hypothetical protein